MKERLEKLIAEAKREYTRYCFVMFTSPEYKDVPQISEAAFIAEKLIAAGVRFRLVVPRKGEKENDL